MVKQLDRYSLKRCQKCKNKEVDLVYRHEKFSLECYECKHRIAFQESEDKAIELWNNPE